MLQKRTDITVLHFIYHRTVTVLTNEIWVNEQMTTKIKLIIIVAKNFLVKLTMLKS